MLVFIFLFGMCVGSFLNVLIHRLPLSEDVVFIRSHCPSCKNTIKWFMNIPLFSYVFLRGKCFFCEVKISPRYPAIEVLSGLVMLFFYYGQGSDTGNLGLVLFYFAIYSVFLSHFLIDLKHQILPDSLNILLFALFLGSAILEKTWSFSLFGFFIGGGFPLLITWLFFKIKGQVGLGGGDIKLYAVLGIHLGVVDVLNNIFLSCFLGSIIGLVLILIGKLDKNNPLPFGPFILVVASFQIFFPISYKAFRQMLISV